MQPVPGLDPQPQPSPRRRVVVGVDVQGRGNWRILIGLAIVGWGVLLTMANLGLDGAYFILDRWYFPGVLTVLGLFRLSQADSGPARVVGAGVTGLGLWWLASEAFGFRFHIWNWWPLALVFAGLMMIKRSRDATLFPPTPGASAFTGATASMPGVGDATAGASAGAGAASGSAADVVDGGPVSGFAFWSGIARRVSGGFKRGNVAAFMGGIELDFRNAVAVGGRAELEIFVMMGGVEITVPPDWTVANEALVIMGGIDDRSVGSSTAPKTLVIKGLILMGGVEIKT